MLQLWSVPQWMKTPYFKVESQLATQVGFMAVYAHVVGASICFNRWEGVCFYGEGWGHNFEI